MTPEQNYLVQQQWSQSQPLELHVSLDEAYRLAGTQNASVGDIEQGNFHVSINSIYGIVKLIVD